MKNLKYLLIENFNNICEKYKNGDIEIIINCKCIENSNNIITQYSNSTNFQSENSHVNQIQCSDIKIVCKKTNNYLFTIKNNDNESINRIADDDDNQPEVTLNIVKLKEGGKIKKTNSTKSRRLRKVRKPYKSRKNHKSHKTHKTRKYKTTLFRKSNK